MSRKRANRGGEERRWHGLGVSEGVATGRVLRVHRGARPNVYRATLDPADVSREARRFRAAVRLSRRQLLAIKRRAEQALGADHAYIFDAHLLMLEDRQLLDEVEDYIRHEHANAEWALKVVADRLLAVYAEIKDEYLRARSSDIEDVLRRLLFALSGAPPSRRLTEDAVIVAEELLPSTAAELDLTHVRAIASDVGGWTSHTAIIARGLGIPAVVGLRDLYRHTRTGDEIAVDANTGEVVLHPSAATGERVRAHRSSVRNADSRAVLLLRRLPGSDFDGEVEVPDAYAPLHTRDGAEIVLRANLELPAEYAGVSRYGARGVGLYRSEFLLSQRGGMPTEDEQCAAYVEVGKLGGADGAKVRLFDLGGDKMSAANVGETAERNPALGLRAIRFCLREQTVLRTQVRAVLRAAAQVRLDLVLPMVSDVTDVRRARAVIEEERTQLEQAGQRTGALKIGAMIEVPSAVLIADKLAREVDFFSIGTNDLVQYLLAVDRGSDEVAEWFRTLHPAVLQSIERTLAAGAAANIPVEVCGEMAATPAYACILVGLGARDLSMTASSIPRLRHVLAQLDTPRAAEIALACLDCESADAAEELVRVRLGQTWPHLFPPESLPAPKPNA